MADESDEYNSTLAKAKLWFRECESAREEWAGEAKECFDFEAGHQWDPEDLKKLQEEQRPAITFNRTRPVVNAVSGAEVTNRQEVQYIPRELNDRGASEVFMAAAEWVRDSCDAADEESDAFRDKLIGGMGWTNTRLDFETDPDGMIVVERVDPFEMWWDHNAKRRNLKDARYVMRVKDVPLMEARAEFPGKEDHELDASWAADYGSDMEHGPHDQNAAKEYRGDQPKQESDDKRRVRIVEVQWWDYKTVWRVKDPATEQLKAVSDEDYKIIKENASLAGVKIKAVKQKVRAYKQAFIGEVVLSEDDNAVDEFTYQCMTGYRDRNRNVWSGIVSASLDPQRWANKWLSQTLHIMNSGAKGGLYVEEGATKDIRKLEEKFAQPGPVLQLANGGLTKIKERTQTQMPTGFEKAMEWGIVAIRDSTGVSVEAQGLADRQQAGVLEMQRKQATLTILATLFDSLRLYRKRQGRVLLEMIQKYISDGRMVRVIGENSEAQYIPLTKQPETIKYDIVVDDAPDAPNMKERVWGIIQSLLPAMQNAPIQVWAALIDYAPLPESLAAKLKEALSGATTLPPEAQQQMEMMGKELEKTKQENAKLKDKKDEQQAQLIMDAKKQQHEMTLAETKAQFEMDLAKFKAEQEAEIAAFKVQMEKKLADQKMELEGQKMRQQVSLERQKMAAEKGTPMAKKFKLIRGEDNKISGVEEEVAEPKSPKRKIKVGRGKDGRVSGFELD